MASPFNMWLAPRFVSLFILQAAADNNSQQQQRPQPPHNYSCIDTTLTVATPHTTMTTRAFTGHAQRP
eukprot:1441363-Amphidinium_carterae.1